MSTEPPTAHASLEPMLREALERAVYVALCGTYCKASGLTEADLVEGVRVGAIADLAFCAADRVVSF